MAVDPISLGVIGAGAGLNALGSWLGGKSQAQAMEDMNKQNADLTRAAWARDDTAVSRRVSDLHMAGLNPVLAAGSAAGNSSPIPMQSAADTGVADAMKSAGQSTMSAPGMLQELRRSAAATVLSESQAKLVGAQARIATHDAGEIEANRDPRNKGVIDQLLSGMPKLLKAVKDSQGSVSEFINGKNTEIKKADDYASEAIRIMRNPNVSKADVSRAKALNAKADAIRQGGYK
ncbi:MAG: hypothetical protein [Microviridae sp.]|nr:MAG: hypothetical protein [Microviridae sp.]